MNRCALSSLPRLLIGPSTPADIWAARKHSSTGHLKPIARSSRSEAEDDCDFTRILAAFVKYICSWLLLVNNTARLFPRRIHFLHQSPRSENHTQQETPLLDRECGEVTVTDPAHPLYGQTLPLLPVRINRIPLHVMVLLPSGRRHMVPRAATDLERPGEAVSPASPLPPISVRTILPLARLVHQLKQAKEESHAEQTASTIYPTEPCVPSSHDDLSSASPKPPAATRAPDRRPHSARANRCTRQGGRP